MGLDEIFNNVLVQISAIVSFFFMVVRGSINLYSVIQPPKKITASTYLIRCASKKTGLSKYMQHVFVRNIDESRNPFHLNHLEIVFDEGKALRIGVGFEHVLDYGHTYFFENENIHVIPKIKKILIHYPSEKPIQMDSRVIRKLKTEYNDAKKDGIV